MLSLIIIIDCNTIYRQYLSGGYIYSISAILFLLLIILTHKEINVKTLFIPALFVLTCPLFYICQIDEIHSDSSFRTNLYVVNFFIFFPIVYLYFCLTKNKFSLLFKFSSVMSLVALYSSILWLLCSIFQIIPMPQLVLNNWADIEFVPSFYYIYFETQAHIFFGLDLVRNTAVFAEAPMFAICLFMSFAIEVLLKDKINKVHVFALAAGIISTTSTTAYIVTMLILLFKYINSTKAKQLLFFLIPTIILLFFVFIILLQEKESGNAISYYTRLSGYTKGYEVFMNNFWFGKGFYSQTESNSNSILVLLSEIGIIGGMPFLYGLFLTPLLLILNRNSRKVGYWGFVFFLGYCVTIVTYCIISFVFTSFLMSNMNYKAYR